MKAFYEYFNFAPNFTMIQLENANLKLTISKLGAEIKASYINPNKENACGNRPAVWGRTAPILFPIVGQEITITV